MNKLIQKLAVIFAVMLSIPLVANADITMTVDAANDTIFFSGNASGTPADSMGSDYVDWTTGYTSGSMGFVDLTSGAINGTIVYGSLTIYTESSTGIRLLFLGGDLSSITGTEQTISYSSLTSAQMTVLESFIGQTLTLNEGTDFGNISIVAVPEPSTYASLAGLAALGFLFYRRRKLRAA